MIIKQSHLFGQQKKKLHKNQIQILDKAIKEILENPHIGKLKVGDLHNIRTYKFKMLDQQCLLAYENFENHIILHALGSHENFYRDLKRVINEDSSVSYRL